MGGEGKVREVKCPAWLSEGIKEPSRVRYGCQFLLSRFVCYNANVVLGRGGVGIDELSQVPQC